jgi:hypothetical protein
VTAAVAALLVALVNERGVGLCEAEEEAENEGDDGEDVGEVDCALERDAVGVAVVAVALREVARLLSKVLREVRRCRVSNIFLRRLLLASAAIDLLPGSDRAPLRLCSSAAEALDGIPLTEGEATL